MSAMLLVAVAAGLLLTVPGVNALSFYVPAVEPHSYSVNEEVDINVNSLRSLSEILPYDYYTLPFCKPAHIRYKPEILGEIIWGDKVQTSEYRGQMKKDVACQLLTCDVDANNKEVKEKIDLLESYINKGYRGYMNIDNLPAWNNDTTIFNGNCQGAIPKEQLYTNLRGYAIGVHKNCRGKTLINNHLAFRIEVNPVVNADGTKQYRVVGFTASPHSVKHQPDGGDCRDVPQFDPRAGDIVPLTTDDIRAGEKLLWSYSIQWVEEPSIKWATRWDSYLRTGPADTANGIHWMYIVTTLVIAVSLALVVSIILLRTLHRDFNRYNNPLPDEEVDEIGWKLVHADVFRPPQRVQLLCALVGNGVQILAMFVGTMFFAMMGLLSPAARGGLLTCIILLYVFMSFVGGYTCGRLLKYFEVQEWKHVFLCACAFPFTVCFFYFVSDIINATHHASDAVPFMTLLTIFCLWLCISVPLTVLGASFAFHQLPIVNPVNVGKLAREIPVQRWYLQPWVLYAVCPVLPLVAILLELKFIFSSLWQGMVYYVFGFLVMVFIVWTITVILTTIISVYYMLCNENHRWWWSSFIAPGGLGIHMLVYAAYFFHTQLDITAPAATMLYFIYMSLLSVAYGISAGALGTVASMFFTRKIYGSIKID